MTKIKIVSDSCCDLPQDVIKKYDISIIPANVIFGDEVISHYKISNKDFYNRLINGEMPSTAVPSPNTFKEVYENALKKADELIVFTLSSKLSAMFNTASLVAKQFFKDKITVIDTKTVTLEMGLIVFEAAKKVANGVSKEELLDYINNTLLAHSSLIGVLDTLKYVKKSGRISTIPYIVGSLLSTKPIIHIENGLLVSPGKIFGSDHAIDFLKKFARKALETRIIDTIVVGHSANVEKGRMLEKFFTKLNVAPENILFGEIGPIIGTHVGPNALGFAWIGSYSKDWL